MNRIKDYEGQCRLTDYSQRLARKGDTDLALSKYLCYDDPQLLDLIFAEVDRREGL